MRARSRPIGPLTIPRQLTLGFGLVLACIVILGVLSIRLARDQGAVATTIVRDAIPLDRSARDLLLQMVNEETGVRAYVVTGQETVLLPYREGRVRASADLTDLRTREAASPALDQVLDTRVHSQVQQIDAFFARLIAQVRAGHRSTARARIAQGKRQFDAFRVTMAAVFRQTDRLVGDAQALSARDVAATRRTVQAGTVIAALVALAVGVLLTRSVARPLRQLTDVVARLAAGDLAVERALPTAGGDEVGTLTASFRSLVAHQRQVTAVANAVARGDVSVIRDLAAATERLRAVYTAMAGAVVVLDGAGRIVDANAAAEELLGVGLDEMRGRVLSHSLWTALSLDGSPLPPEERPVWTALRTGQPQRHRLVAFLRPDGEKRVVQIDAVPLAGDDGRPVQVVVSYVDLTARLRAEETLRASEARFRALTEQASDLVSILAADGVYRYASPAHERLLGRAPAALVGQNILAVVHPDDRPRTQAAFRAARATPGTTARIEFRLGHADGTWRWVEAIGNNLLHDPAVDGIVVSGRDVTERKQTEAALDQLARRHELILTSAGEGIYGLDRQGLATFVNPVAAALVGYPLGELIGRPMHALLHHTRADGTPYPLDECPIHRTLTEGRAAQVTDEVFWRKDGSAVPVEYTSTPLHDDGQVIGVVVNFRDITERLRAEETLRHQALYDALTDLPNRALLRERLEQAVRMARRDHRPLALLVLDLDGFKEVNDTFGHQQGDVLLQDIAARLRGPLRASDTVARLGGDEFAVLLPASDEAGADEAAATLRATLDSPLAVAGQAVHIGASIGIALYPAHGADATTLLRHADTAMYAAKRAGHGPALYDAAQDPHSAERLGLLADLRQAITGGGLTLYYQPKVELATGRLRGVEALVRWPHPRQGLIPPDRFITLAEQHGLIGPLTLWVLEEALRQSQAWARAEWDLSVAVNLSAWSLHDPGLLEIIAALLRRHDAPPRWLRLELTESSVMADAERALEVLTRLAALGVGLSVDDFGTGYSSLAYLKRLPVDEVKIDRSFVRDLTSDEADAAIVRSTVGLGHSLGLQVVAEGVEDRATWDLLAELGCDVAQGYYLARPLPAAEFEQWVRVAPWAVA